MELTVVVQNLGHGGLRNGAGDPEDRWPALAERLLSAGPPDLALLQEAVDWDRYGHRQLGRAMRDLDMDATPLPPSPSGYRPALLYRRETVGRWLHWNTDFADQTLHGFGVAVFDVGLPAPLAVISAHLNPFSADSARAEAKLLAARAMRYGPYGMICGDINYPPHHPDHPAPDYGNMLPFNRSARTRLPSESPGGQTTPDRRVTEMLSYSGYIDAAWHLHQHGARTGDPALLHRTATDDRIDQAWTTVPLAPAITDYRRLPAPAGASDHDGIMIRLNTSLAATDNIWDYR